MEPQRFNDLEFGLLPYFLWGMRSSFKDLGVTFFPYVPNHKARERIPESSNYGILEEFFLPILDFFLDSAFPPPWLSKNFTPLSPNLSEPLASLQ